MCAEHIKFGAVVCRFCGHKYDPEEVRRLVEQEQARLLEAPPDRAARLLAAKQRRLEEPNWIYQTFAVAAAPGGASVRD